MKILLVDDSSAFQRLVKERLGQDHDITITSTVTTAIKYLQKSVYDLVVIDWMLPFKSGKSLLDWVEKNKPGQKLWVNTQLDSSEIKKYTNGHRVFKKDDGTVIKAVQQL